MLLGSGSRGYCAAAAGRDQSTQPAGSYSTSWTPRSSWGWVKALLHSIYDQPDAKSVHAQFDRVAETLAEKLPAVAEHLEEARADPATVRAGSFDMANLARFLEEQQIALSAVEPIDVFAWVDWQGARTPATHHRVVRLKPRSAARHRPRSTAGSPPSVRSSSSW